MKFNNWIDWTHRMNVWCISIWCLVGVVEESRLNSNSQLYCQSELSIERITEFQDSSWYWLYSPQNANWNSTRKSRGGISLFLNFKKVRQNWATLKIEKYWEKKIFSRFVEWFFKWIFSVERMLGKSPKGIDAKTSLVWMLHSNSSG